MIQYSQAVVLMFCGWFFFFSLWFVVTVAGSFILQWIKIVPSNQTSYSGRNTNLDFVLNYAEDGRRSYKRSIGQFSCPLFPLFFSLQPLISKYVYLYIFTHSCRSLDVEKVQNVKHEDQRGSVRLNSPTRCDR